MDSLWGEEQGGKADAGNSGDDDDAQDTEGAGVAESSSSDDAEDEKNSDNDDDEFSDDSQDGSCRLGQRCSLLLQWATRCGLDSVLVLLQLVRRHGIGNSGFLLRPYWDDDSDSDGEENRNSCVVLATTLFSSLSSDQLLNLFRPWVGDPPCILVLQGDRGDTPLQTLLKNHSDPSLLPLIQLLFGCSEVFRLENFLGHTPLALACQHSLSDDAIEFLLEADPGALELQDSYSNLPLHFACRNVALSPEVVQRLVDAHPEALSHPNIEDETAVSLGFRFARGRLFSRPGVGRPARAHGVAGP